jgi:molecular chaperone DnaJ
MGRRVRDPYELLGVDRQATTAEIKAAFRRLAAQTHPDKNPDDPHAQARFQELNEASQILGDPQKRAAFDRYGPSAFRPGGVDAGVPGGGLGGLDGLFGDLLGAIGIRTGARGDIRKRVRLTFEEAALGTTKELSYERLDLCERCGGRGGEPGSGVETCGACGGRGRHRASSGMLQLPFERACSSCRGTGQVPRVRCTTCAGRGLTRRARTVEVQVPAGVEAGSSRTVPRNGDRLSPEGTPGDLLVVVDVAPHPFFRRDGDDVVCEVPVSFTSATLGGEVEVATLEGRTRLRVPPGTQPGSRLRLRGLGLPRRYRSGRGDLLVRVSVTVPTQLSDKARDLIAELGQELGEPGVVTSEGWFDRLRRMIP